MTEYSTAAPTPFQRHLRTRRWFVSLLLAGIAVPAPVAAQGSYRNTDAARSTRVEDAYAIPRYAVDMYVSPIGIERDASGELSWGGRPGLAYGLLPRTQVAVAVPLVSAVGGGGRRVGAAGVDLSILYNLNTETGGLPAFGLRASTLVPAGPAGPAALQSRLRGIATRTVAFGRVHVNGDYTWGGAPDGGRPSAAGSPLSPLTRWTAGVALDHSFVRRALLASVEAVASEPNPPRGRTEWAVGGSLRYQLDPSWVLDGGIGRRLAVDPAWYLTLGISRLVAVKALMPGRGAWAGGR